MMVAGRPAGASTVRPRTVAARDRADELARGQSRGAAPPRASSLVERGDHRGGQRRWPRPDPARRRGASSSSTTTSLGHAVPRAAVVLGHVQPEPALLGERGPERRTGLGLGVECGARHCGRAVALDPAPHGVVEREWSSVIPIGMARDRIRQSDVAAMPIERSAASGPRGPADHRVVARVEIDHRNVTARRCLQVGDTPVLEVDRQ